MLYIILGLFVVVGLGYPIYCSKTDKLCKAYFIECLEHDIYYPDTDYILDHDMEDDVKADMEVMLEIAQKYMKSPEFDNEYLRRYKIGFDIYKNENLEDLERYLRERHERKMQDPEYRKLYAAYEKMEKRDVSGKIYRTFLDVKRKKPNKRIFKENIKRLQDKMNKK